MRPVEFHVRLPDWVADAVPWDTPLASSDDRVGLAVALSRENVGRGTGGPFGAVVCDQRSGLPVAAGVNLVEHGGSAVLHAEVVALMLAHAALRRYALGGDDRPYILASSCEPCAMCLGAALWSGVGCVEIGAARQDAERAGFEEGPVFPASYDYLRAHGMQFAHGVRREEAAAVIEAYHRSGGTIYNG